VNAACGLTGVAFALLRCRFSGLYGSLSAIRELLLQGLPGGQAERFEAEPNRSGSERTLRGSVLMSLRKTKQ
jgi:hypothetical protein